VRDQRPTPDLREFLTKLRAEKAQAEKACADLDLS